MTIAFTDRVAIVTGAGGGLGRAYALELARRGAKVVVNDLGGARDGTGHSDAALAVVKEIEALGGEAFSNGGSVTEYDQMVAMAAQAKARWGRIDILINNAGVLRDKSFAKMEPADFEFVVNVHLIGSANCTKAVWETMREANYGRILMTASSTGLYGKFRPGQLRRGQARAGGAHQDAPPRRRQAQYPRQHARPRRGDADDRGHLSRGGVQGLRAGECRARRAVPRLRGRADQRDRRRGRGRVPVGLCDADAGRAADRRRTEPRGASPRTGRRSPTAPGRSFPIRAPSRRC